MDGVSKTQVSRAVSSVVGEKDKRAPKKKCVGSDVTSVSRNLIITCFVFSVCKYEFIWGGGGRYVKK